MKVIVKLIAKTVDPLKGTPYVALWNKQLPQMVLDSKQPEETAKKILSKLTRSWKFYNTKFLGFHNNGKLYIYYNVTFPNEGERFWSSLDLNSFSKEDREAIQKASVQMGNRI